MNEVLGVKCNVGEPDRFSLSKRWCVEKLGKTENGQVLKLHKNENLHEMMFERKMKWTVFKESY